MASLAAFASALGSIERIEEALTLISGSTEGVEAASVVLKRLNDEALKEPGRGGAKIEDKAALR